MLRKEGGNIGGETSGHMICMDHAETGDGLITALQILAIMIRAGKPLSELTKNLKKFPQITENVNNKNNFDIDKSKEIRSVIDEAKKQLIGSGRVILRSSGTEPLVRITVEGEDYKYVSQVTKQLASKVSSIIS